MRTTTIKFCMLLTMFAINIGQMAFIEENTAQAAPVEIDKLIQSPTGTDITKEQEVVGKLPKVEAQTLLTIVIKYILRLAAILTMIALIITAIYYLISMGKEEDISKARNTLIYLIIGIVIIASSYGIVTGISQFDFFTEPAN